MMNISRIRNWFVLVSAVMLSSVLWADVTTVPEGENDALLKRIEAQTQERKDSILGTKTSITPSETGTTYYVSNKGNDANPGKGADMAWATLTRVNEAEFEPGDVVFFERGGLWRGQLKAKEGVTYSAYGEGAKPKIYGSPEDAGSPEKWKATETKNVYLYHQPLKKDVGTLVFNHGAEHAIKVIIRTEADGKTFNNTTGDTFKTYADLKRDLHFYHDYLVTGNLYLYSEKGNPGSRFSSIELNVKGNIIQITGNGVTIDNLCIKYGGAHGVGSGTTKNLTVQNCELGWIGGSIQAEGIYGRNHATRYGNAVEIWGGCETYTVDHCYIYQVYDAGMTHQIYTEGKVYTMKNVRYSNNLIEYCNYSIEYFVGSAKEGDGTMMDGFVIENNIMRFAGIGFCRQRPDKTEAAHIKSWNHDNPAAGDNFLVRNNIFQESFNMILHISSAFPDNMPKMQSNTYIQKRGGLLGLFGQNAKPRQVYDEKVGNIIGNPKQIGDTNAVIIFTP